MDRRQLSPRWTRDARSYDRNGDLTVPVWFWVIQLWLLLPWWLTAGGIAAGRDMTSQLYPDQAFLLAALVCGLPVFLMAFIYPLRAKTPVLAQLSAILLWGGALSSSVLMAFRLLSADVSQLGLYGSLFCIDLAVMVQLSFTPRLRYVFFPVHNGQLMG